MENDKANSQKSKKKLTRKDREQLKLDQILRVLFKLSKDITIQLINGLFDEKFVSSDVSIAYSNGEFVDDEYDRTIGDMFITVTSKQETITFHIEFQTLNDNMMVVRLFQYGFKKALEEAQASGAFTTGNPQEKILMKFPRQLVIYLEENEAIQESQSLALSLPDGREVEYTVPTMKYWTYTPEMLKRQKLYALLPLLAFSSRKRLKLIYESKKPEKEKSLLISEQFEQMKKTIEKTLEVLGELHDAKEIGTGDLERILRVLQNITTYLYVVTANSERLTRRCCRW
ncbi:hypothetical protein [Paenibacillus eucommiae]|uniref:Uncharacterized protein n=1 Tax=Paenibacillus eucommiae TaxID=1355755 RepID=A0ABS4INF0_9BACL|nr:hypothetical protein [Paenibacillus eucommiae]MBP1988436.1 hypothetical protein [Paenibacillus eucommiae]